MEGAQSMNTREPSPSSEVLEKPVRRRFTVEYKARILAEADACTQPGLLGELLRREGLYSSHLATWRRQRDEGVLAGLTPKRRGRRAKAKNPLAGEVAWLQRENQRLKEQLRQAELIIDVQKKVSEMLNIPLNSPDGEESD
jgi:transposase-like protein